MGSRTRREIQEGQVQTLRKPVQATLARCKGREKVATGCCMDAESDPRWPHVERGLTLGIARMTALSRPLSGCYTNEGCTLLRVLERMPIAWK